MKKTILILLAAVLVLAAPAARAEGGFVTVYQSNFSVGMDGWYGRGDAVTLTPGLNWLKVEGRKSSWHSPGRDFDLTEGCPYQISVQVRQDEMDSAEMMLSVAHTLDGKETYENLARAQVKRDAWTTLQCTYTPGYYEKFVLYVETVGAPEMSFEFRLFRLEAPEGSEAAQAVSQDTGAQELPSLKQVYADAFDFGCALPGYAVNRKEVRELFLSQFSILTPENELKPDSVLDVATSRKLAQEDETAAAVRLDRARPLMDFAKANGLKVHGHVLVWHSQTPEAFFHEGYDTARPLVTREVMLGRMENYIRGVFEAAEEMYPGLIVSWDVVNEAIDDGTNRLRDSNWLKTVGEDFVARAFEYARKYAPEGTLLYYNDYNTAVPGKLKGILDLLQGLLPEGNIDGYGFQMHHTVGYPSMGLITSAVEKVAALGLKMRVSELDVGIDANTEADLRRQADKYREIMRLVLRFRDAFEAVQVWGVSDPMSWRSGTFPLLFDAGLNPKPAFFAVADPAGA